LSKFIILKEDDNIEKITYVLLSFSINLFFKVSFLSLFSLGLFRDLSQILDLTFSKSLGTFTWLWVYK